MQEKAKPPNAFCWYARFLADQSRSNGRPFRSVKAVIHEAAVQWEKLSLEEKLDWKEKAREERIRFRNDPDLRTMTNKEFIGQACEFSTNGMVTDDGFWSRHWSKEEREQNADELSLLEHFDSKKRAHDRDAIKDYWTWAFTDKNEELRETRFLFISVQSSLPVEAQGYIPETMAFLQFSFKDGIVPYTEFCCALISDEDRVTSRRNGAKYAKSGVGDKDGCQTRLNAQVVAKMIFERVEQEPSSKLMPLFFCMADEFEAVYDALCALKRYIPTKSPGDRRLSVYSVAAIEDLAHCWFDWMKIPLPEAIKEFQSQLYFGGLMERSPPGRVAELRCDDHEINFLTRCPRSVVRLAALKIKEWSDKGGILDEDLPLLEHQLSRPYEWPSLEIDFDDEYQEEDENCDVEDTVGVIGNQIQGSEVGMAHGKHEMTLAWVKSQEMVRSANACQPEEKVQGSINTVDSGDKIGSAAIASLVSKQKVVDGGSVKFQTTQVVPAQQRSFVTNHVGRHAAAGIGVAVEPQKKLPVINARGIGAGTELEYQSQLPFNARGIGRGLHLVPGYVEEFNFLKSFLKG